MNAPAHNTALDAQHPWPGLRSFAEADSAYFFGRENETRALRDLVERAPVVVLYGQSGLGKTSLLRAGLFPALNSAAYLPVWVRLDWSTSAPSPTAQVLQALALGFQQAGVEAPLAKPDDSLWSYFHRADADFWGARNRLVTPIIVLDQFEELFTLGRRDPGATARTEAFVRDLEAQFEQRPPAAVRQRLEQFPDEAAAYDQTRDNVRFIVSLREDYLPHLDAWRDRLPSMLARRYRLEPMTRQQALQVVQRAGSALVSDAVAEDVVAFVATGGAEQRVEPAILSVVCNELNLRRVRAGLPQITRELMSGERGRIIEDFYERSFEGISENTRDWVEDELLTASGHRDRAALEDGSKAGVDSAELDRLVERRVLHSDERNGVQWVEFTHDLLAAPALASRTVRQRRQADASARRREDEVRGKLRRSRMTSAVFGLMALVMAAGAWWLSDALAEAKSQRSAAAGALDEARAQTALAMRERTRADEEAGRARQREQEAERAADGERRATVDAEAALARAVEAEAAARSSLTRAQQTALATAQQAVAKLKEQWINPTFDSASVVQTNIDNVAPLIAQFGDLPAMRTAQRQLLALGALVHFDRSEEAHCTRLANLSQLVPSVAGQRLPAVIEAEATSLLAQGNCLRLRARSTQAGTLLVQAATRARELPAASADRARLVVLATVGRGRAAMARYAFDEAKRALQDTDRELDAATASTLPDAELTGLRIVAASLQANLAPSVQEALAALDKASMLMQSLPPNVRESTHWRGRQLTLDHDRAWTLKASEQAEADDLGRRALTVLNNMLEVEPTHIQRQVMRFNFLRLRAEIQHSWGRKQASLAILEECRKAAELVAQREPGLSLAAYQNYVVAWLLATRSNQPVPAKRAQLQQSMKQLQVLVNDAPDYAAAQRSVAVLHGELARLDEEEARDTKRPEVERNTLMTAALVQRRAALSELDKLSRASQHPDVADLAYENELAIGDMELLRKQPAAALTAFRRAAHWHSQVPQTGPVRLERVHDEVLIQQRIARSFRAQRQTAEAEAVDRAALAVVAEVRRQQPERFALLDLQAWTHRMAAADQLESGDLKGAVASQVAAAELLFGALKRNPLSKAIEESLAAVIKFAGDQLWNPVVKTEDAALRKQLLAINSYRPTLAAASKVAERLRSPLIPGDWEHQTGDRMQEADLGVAEEAQALRKAGWTLVGARRLLLRFYDNAHLVELDLRKGRDEVATAVYVTQTGRKTIAITGAYQLLLDLNESQNLDLSSAVQAGQYIRFYFWAVSSDQGRLRLVEQLSDLMWHPEADDKVRARIEALIEPLELQKSASGAWAAQATAQYGARLKQVKWTFERNGSLTFARELDVEQRDLPLVTETFRGGLRVLDPSVATPALLNRRIELADQQRNWTQAAQAQQELTDHLLKATPEDKRSGVLPKEYLALSWYRFLGAQFEPAIAAADAGLAMLPSNLPLQTNRAHALLLLGREKEAMDIYQRHIGKPISADGRKLWQAEILDDLKKFDDYGIKDPRFAEVRQLMEAAKK